MLLLSNGFPMHIRPFPANLMIGCYGLVASDAGSIALDLDNELEDAQWFTKESVLKVLCVIWSSTSTTQPRANRVFQ